MRLCNNIPFRDSSHDTWLWKECCYSWNKCMASCLLFIISLITEINRLLRIRHVGCRGLSWFSMEILMDGHFFTFWKLCVFIHRQVWTPACTRRPPPTTVYEHSHIFPVQYMNIFYFTNLIATMFSSLLRDWPCFRIRWGLSITLQLLPHYNTTITPTSIFPRACLALQLASANCVNGVILVGESAVEMIPDIYRLLTARSGTTISSLCCSVAGTQQRQVKPMFRLQLL